MARVRSTWLLALALAGCGVAAGCSDIAVRRVGSPDLLDAWKASAFAGDELSPRTLQTLRRWDLEAVERRDPDAAVARLHAEALKEPRPELLFALAEMNYRCGRRAEKWACADAVVYYYLSAGYAYHYIFDDLDSRDDARAKNDPAARFEVFDPRFRLACDLYNASLAKCVAAAQRAGRLDPRAKLRLPTCDREGFLLAVVHEGFAWKPEEFGPLEIAGDYEVIGLANQYRTYGLGVPLIGTRVAAPAQGKHDYVPPSVRFPVTAFFRFDGGLADLAARRTGQLELYNPLNIQALNVRGHPVPLETDLTTPLAYCLAHSGLQGAEYSLFLNPEKIGNRGGIHMLEPYQPGKIPVLLVHGLLSTPLTWAPALNDLRADAELRERFQFWVYFYPTSDPYFLTAADLRRALAQLRADVDPQHKDPALDEMVFITHSMGGLVSKLLTVDGGDDFWKLMSDRPLAGLRLTADTRRELQDLFYFRRQPCVKRVVFMATPHHGSKLSPSLVGRLAIKLAGVPKSVMSAAKDVVTENPDLPDVLQAEHIPTSVDLLAPGAPALELLAARHRPEGVHYHSVVGVSTSSTTVVERFLSGSDEPGDGVVPYSSAHLDDAESELVVPADHSHVHHHPLALLELRRILRAHYQEMMKRQPVIPASARSTSRPGGQN